jgi:hypothetical protein
MSGVEFLLLAVVNLGWNAPQLSLSQDTITIDGVPLELNLALSKEEVGVPDVDAPSKSKSKTRTWRGEFPDVLVGFTGGVGGQLVSPVGLGLGRFMGRGSDACGALSVAMEWRGQGPFLRLGFEAKRWTEQAYAASALNDSIYGLGADGVGGLEQRIRFTYPDLGIELDTLPMPVSAIPVQSLGFALSLGGTSDAHRRSRRPGPRWWLGAKGQWVRSARTEQQINRVPEGALPSPANVLGTDRNDWESTQYWAVGLHGGLAVPVGRRGWECLLIGDWSGGSAPRWAASVGLQKRWGNR